MVLWGGMVHKYTMLKEFSITLKFIYYGHTDLFSALIKVRLFFFGVLEFEVIELGHFGFDPGFEQP